MPSDSSAVLEGQEAHHLIQVLRAGVGTQVELIDGHGGLWSGRVGKILGDRVALVDVSLVSKAAEPNLTVTLVQALCKADRLSWILQKVTEVGISDIYLVQAQRSVVRIPAERHEAKLNRWRTILANAAKQSRRTTIPALYPPVECGRVCNALRSDCKLLLKADPQTTGIKTVLRGATWRSVVFAVGPEGGWTDEECTTFLDSGFQAVSLGSSILRTETAAVVAAALLRYELSETSCR